MSANNIADWDPLEDSDYEMPLPPPPGIPPPVVNSVDDDSSYYHGDSFPQMPVDQPTAQYEITDDPQVTSPSNHKRGLSMVSYTTPDGVKHIAFEGNDGTIEFFRTISTVGEDQPMPSSSSYNESEINEMLQTAIYQQQQQHPTMEKQKTIQPAELPQFEDYYPEDDDDDSFMPPPPVPPVPDGGVEQFAAPCIPANNSEASNFSIQTASTDASIPLPPPQGPRPSEYSIGLPQPSIDLPNIPSNSTDGSVPLPPPRDPREDPGSSGQYQAYNRDMAFGGFDDGDEYAAPRDLSHFNAQSYTANTGHMTSNRTAQNDNNRSDMPQGTGNLAYCDDFETPLDDNLIEELTSDSSNPPPPPPSNGSAQTQPNRKLPLPPIPPMSDDEADNKNNDKSLVKNSSSSSLDDTEAQNASSANNNQSLARGKRKAPPAVSSHGGYDTSIAPTNTTPLQSLTENEPVAPLPASNLYCNNNNNTSSANNCSDNTEMQFETVDITQELDKNHNPQRPSRPSAYARLSSTPRTLTLANLAPPPPLTPSQSAGATTPRSNLNLDTLPPLPASPPQQHNRPKPPPTHTATTPQVQERSTRFTFDSPPQKHQQMPPQSPPPIPPVPPVNSPIPGYSPGQPPPPPGPPPGGNPAQQLSLQTPSTPVLNAGRVGDTSLFFNRLKSPVPSATSNASSNTSLVTSPGGTTSINVHTAYSPTHPPLTPKPLADLHSVGKLQIHSQAGPSTASKAPVTDVRRVAHFTFDPDRGEYSDVPEEWKHELKKKFGIPLQLSATCPVEGYEGRLPPVLVFMKSFLVEHGGLQQIGIFRLAPDGGLTAKIKEDLNRNTFSGCPDVNVMAHLIKVFLREMPVMLLDYVKDKQLILNLPETPTAVGKFIMEYYQEPQLSLWLWVLDLCCDVADLQHVNKMGIPNMGIVISPNVYKPPDSTVDPAATMRQCKKFTTFVDRAIEWRMNTVPKHQRPRGY